MIDFTAMALTALFRHLSDKESVDQFNAQAEEGNFNEFAEIVRREIKYDYVNNKLILL